jgi:putative lipoprotein
MNLVSKTLFLSFFIFPICLAQTAAENPQKQDRWFAKDKIEHFSLSAFYSTSTSLVMHRHFEFSKEHSIVIGASVTVSLGVLKEGIDFKTHSGTASKKDFIWDLAGTLTGALIAGFAL